MKKTLLGSLILLAFAGNVQAAANAETSGKVTFFGKVVENTCKVKTENKDMSVVLNDVGKSHLKNARDTAMPTPFTITLTDCNPTVTGNGVKANKVGLYFYSWKNADKDHDFTLKNEQPDGNKASMVNIQILEANGVNEIKVVGNDTTDFTVPGVANGVVPTIKTKHISSSTNINAAPIDLHFIAQYYATGEATAGKVKSSVDFQIAYE
ncbi:TPA: fimbrial protein [Haemophilus influenzae]